MPLSSTSLAAVPSHSERASPSSPSSSSDDDISTHSTAPSSICSISSFGGDEEHFDNLQSQLSDLIQRLLKEKKEQELVIEAWKVRCGTLEAECVRLAGVVGHLEAKEEARKRFSPVMDAREGLSPPPAVSVEQLTEVSWHRRNPSEASSTSSSPSPKHATVPKPVIPKIDPTKSMSKQSPPPCNSFYLLGHCSVPRCKYCHLYELTPAELEEMKRGAKFHLCNALKNSGHCDDPTCVYGHHCMKGASCARKTCDFNDEQHKGPAVARSVAAKVASGKRSKH